jgi:hypothetical protein
MHSNPSRMPYKGNRTPQKQKEINDKLKRKIMELKKDKLE